MDVTATLTVTPQRLGVSSPVTLAGVRTGRIGVFRGSFTAGSTSDTNLPYLVPQSGWYVFGTWRVWDAFGCITNQPGNNTAWIEGAGSASALSGKSIALAVVAIKLG